MQRVYLVSLRLKKTALENNWRMNYTSLFLVNDTCTRDTFVDFIKNHDEDLDLRTARWEEFANSHHMELKQNVLPVESQLGTITLE